tara:strand:- start:1849 stop:2283 length:435 start_codon:yes stop_codon:yes gene_type:complete
MATSIYVFDSDRMFEAVYREHVDDVEYKMPLIDLYVKGERLWVVTNSNDMKEQPRLTRSIVHFRKDNAKEYVEGDEKLVTHGKVRYNEKRNQLEFFPRFLRKPMLSMRVGRYFGIVVGKCNIDYDKRYYDFKNDRMIFILEEEK